VPGVWNASLAWLADQLELRHPELGMLEVRYRVPAGAGSACASRTPPPRGRPRHRLADALRARAYPRAAAWLDGIDELLAADRQLAPAFRERFDATGDTEAAITHGITSNARLITGAALIMVAVFAGFASGQLVMFQQMGFGLAVAILIDATLVRTVLVPAAMKLVGTANWYLPRSLGWLPRVHVEGGEQQVSTETA
jgi:hypothetical protein